MNIELKNIKVRDIFNGYVNNDTENGVIGYHGLLNIRPKYQREFVYSGKQRDMVIETIRQNCPLNIMYWSKNKDNTFEVLDGQQRTISICEFVNNKFSINEMKFNNLTKDEQEQILDYELLIYICEGTEKEKLDWFERINIAGAKLTQQELRNAVYSGSWLSDAKIFFSKRNCIAVKEAADYLKGSAIQQDYLETTLSWIANSDPKYHDKIETYMSEHQFDSDSNEIRLYFQNVMNWFKAIFPDYYKEMKGLEIGILYNKYKDNRYDRNKMRQEVKELMIDEDITKKNGIFEYLLSNKENQKVLNIRAFTPNQKREQYEKQEGICTKCGGHFDIKEMEADHITPWIEGGKTDIYNCQMLCKRCNRTKSDK